MGAEKSSEFVFHLQANLISYFFDIFLLMVLVTRGSGKVIIVTFFIQIHTILKESVPPFAI